ncbi:MAG: nitrate/nitrite transporter [Gammaproteobacteria bacterium]
MSLIQRVLDKLGFTKKTLSHFIVTAVSSQFIYSINALRTILYDPFRETMGITNTQMGFLFSILGLVGLFAYIPGTWITDRFSSRKIITAGLLVVGVSGFYFATAPTYPVLLFIFVVWGFFQDGPFWASVLKSIRCTAPEEKQATVFGLLELVRGSIEFFTNALAILLIAWIGQELLGIKVAMYVNAGIICTSAILCWFILPEENFLQGANQKEKNKEAWQGVKKALLIPETWLTGFTVCGIYTVYVGILWFTPFLTNVYMMPITLAAVFGLFNTSLTRMFASPLGGIIADTTFHSGVKFMRFTLAVVVILMITIIILPKSNALLYLGMSVMILITISVYMLRGVYFSPIGEMHIPKAISGATMSIAAMVGYSPGFWMNTVNGYLLDRYEAEQAYVYIFSIMLLGAFAGLVCATLMSKRSTKFRELQ